MTLLTHGLGYAGIFILSYLLAYHQIYTFVSLIFLGWALFGLTSIGHEIYHQKDLTLLGNLLGFCCLDLWSVRKSNWIERHNKWHHYNVWEEDEDEHMIDGNQIQNIWHTIKTLTHTYRLTERSVVNYLLVTFRMIFFTQISWWAPIIVYLTNVICVTYFTFITHCAPVIQPETNFVMKQLHRSVDIFAQHGWVTFIMGGFNVHSVHHVSPTNIRDDFVELHQKFSQEYKQDYRTIETWSQLWRLFKYRYRKFSTTEEWHMIIIDGIE
jgi:fatty acid desaturase